ncbi:hypothetical protein HY338_00670, partial [Candidatus Gottesmanbacteria bacterium]|nr:hypothetical protein [Candidatus Gottesmanbacteria bacterium]
YSKGLPDNNLAPGKIIAKYVDRLPTNVGIYFASCCWGAWGEPEPKGVVYVLRQRREVVNYSKLIETCSEIETHSAVVVLSPDRDDQSVYFMKCAKDSRLEEIKTSQGIPVAKMVIINQ